MKFAEYSLKNSLFLNLLTVFVCVAGIFAMFNLRRDTFPAVSFDEVIVTATYPGAPAEDVEKFVTIPIEKELKGINGIKEMTSSSEEGVSTVALKINPDEKDKDKVVDDIRRAVDEVEDLPTDVDDPLVLELESREFPILEISLSGNLSDYELRDLGESLEDQILDISGVSQVRRIGWRDPEIHVELDPQKLKDVHVSVDEVVVALRERNITKPAGELRTQNMEFNIRTTAEFYTPQEIEEVIIRSNDMGNLIRIKDVASVTATFEDKSRIAKVNGKHALAMVVIKRELADAINLSTKVKETVKKFTEKIPEGAEIKIANDYSFYVKRRLNVLTSNGIQGFILVLLMLFLFMEPAPAIATAMGIPFALLATFGVMYAMGMSINLITLLGFIIVLGMLVDDGIVASENVYRHVESGMPVREAVIKGTSEVISPILGSIITTWASFIPILFMTDIIGKFIHSIPIIVIVALAASLVEAFIVLPVHLEHWVKPHKKGEKIVYKDQKQWFKKMVAAYTRILEWSISHRYKVVLMITGGLILAVFLVATQMKIIMFTGEGIEEFYIRAEAPKGTPLDKMDELVKPIEKLLLSQPKEDVESFRTYLGSIEEEGLHDPDSKKGTHLGQFTVFLTPAQGRKVTPQQIIDRIRPELDKIKGFEKLYFYKPKEGPPTGRAVSVSVRGEEFPVMEEIANQILTYLKDVPGVSDLGLNYETGKKQLRVIVDEEKARKYFITPTDVANTVKNVFRGGVATSIKPSKAEEEIDVVVRFPESYRADPEIFKNIYIENRTGNLVPVLTVAKIEEASGVYKINHLDGKRIITVLGDVDDKKATSMKVNQLLQKKFTDISQKHPGYSIKFGGEFEDNQKSLRNIIFSFSLALFFIFIILAQEFKSLLQPFLIMLSIPFGFMGVVFAFYLHGRPLSFFAFLGIVGLAGVVVNSAIVLIDFINRLRMEGMDLRQSLIEAGRTRLRPVLMTSGTTIGGLVSVAYGIGGGDPFLKPMALAIMWGLTFSTILTLIAIPCLYAVFDDFALKFFHHSLVRKTDE